MKLTAVNYNEVADPVEMRIMSSLTALNTHVPGSNCLKLTAQQLMARFRCSLKHTHGPWDMQGLAVLQR